MTSAETIDDLFIGFDRDRGRRQRELTNNTNTKGKYHVRNMLKDISSFAEHQEKATYGLGYNLTLTRKKDDSALDNFVVIYDSRIKIDHIPWYVPHYTPFIQQQGILSKRIFRKTLTELRNTERPGSMKEVNN